MDDKNAERLELARLTVHTTELAAANIRKYLEAHAESALGPSKPVNRVMKIMDDLTKEMEDVINSSAVLAQKSLKQFTGEQ